jgi:hypothetical protein
MVRTVLFAPRRPEPSANLELTQEQQPIHFVDLPGLFSDGETT